VYNITMKHWVGASVCAVSNFRDVTVSSPRASLVVLSCIYHDSSNFQ